MKKFLCDKKGETLVEVLAAILIFTLSSIILYSMVTTASRVNMKALESDASIEKQMAIVEHAETSKGTGEVKMILKNMVINGSTVDKPLDPINVKVYCDDSENSLYSYYKVTPAGK